MGPMVIELQRTKICATLMVLEWKGVQEGKVDVVTSIGFDFY